MKLLNGVISEGCFLGRKSYIHEKHSQGSIRFNFKILILGTEETDQTNLMNELYDMKILMFFADMIKKYYYIINEK